MSFHKQFDYFDPLKGTVPHWPFYEAGPIATRARSLLYGRKSNEIRQLAEDASFLIEAFFDQEREDAIQMLKDRERFDLLDMDEDGHVRGFSDDAGSEFDIATPENTDEVEALREAIGSGFDSATEVQNVKPYEYFAALALWLVGDFVKAMDFVFDASQGKLVKRTSRDHDAAEVARMGSDLIYAMEAVCYGEGLRDSQRSQDRYEERIKKLQTKHEEVSEKDREQVRLEVKKQIEEEAKARRVQQAKENNRRRHQENNDVKKLVLDAWEKDPSKFASAEKAADHFYELLEVKGTPRSHRTVVDWIRARAKEKGIRLR